MNETEKCWMCGRTHEEVLKKLPKTVIEDGYMEAPSQVFKATYHKIPICTICYILIETICDSFLETTPLVASVDEVFSEIITRLKKQ